MPRFAKGVVLSSFAAGLCTLLAAPPAIADARLSGTRLDLGAWSLAAIVEDGAEAPHVIGFLALIDKNQALPGNIVAVWYTRGATDDAPWASQAWTSEDQWVAIETVKAATGISADFDSLWPTNQPIPSTKPQPCAPADYYKGLLSGDPLLPVLNDPDRDYFVEVLADFGYKVADLSLERKELIGDCESGPVLTGLSKQIEATEAAPDNAENAVEVAKLYMSQKSLCQWFCLFWITWTPYFPTTPGCAGWTFGTWAFDHSVPSQGGPSACVYTRENCHTISRKRIIVWPLCYTTTTIQTTTECWTESVTCANSTGATACPIGPTAGCYNPPQTACPAAPGPSDPTHIN